MSSLHRRTLYRILLAACLMLPMLLTPLASAERPQDATRPEMDHSSVGAPSGTAAAPEASLSFPQDKLYIRESSGVVEVDMNGNERSVLYAYPGGNDIEMDEGNLLIWSPSYACWDRFDTNGNWLGTFSPPYSNVTVDGFTVLPADRIAYYDFQYKILHIQAYAGHSLHTDALLQLPDDSRKEMEAVVVGNRLVIFESCLKKVWQIDLDTYARTLLAELPQQGVPYGGIDYADGVYYIVGANGYLAKFTESGVVQQIGYVGQASDHATGIAVAGDFGYVTKHDEGCVYKVDLNTGSHYVLRSGLSAPTDVEVISPESASPDIRVEPNTINVDLRDGDEEGTSSPAGIRSNASVATANSVSGDLVIDITVPEPERGDVELDGKTFQQTWIDGEGQTSDPGLPALPVVTRLVAVPDGKRAVARVARAKETRLSGWQVAPVQPPHSDSEPDIEPPFTIDSELYATDALYPAQVALLQEPVSVRGNKIAALRVFPYRFNPVTEELVVATDLEVVVSFVDDRSQVDEDSPARWPVDLQDLVLNAEAMAKSSSLAADTNPGFLIITAPEFQTAANTLAAYRASQGLDVAVRTTASTGTSASSIRSYIQNAYDAWMPNLAYLLILGDAEYVPPNYFTEHGGHEDRLMGTDLYYATVDGSDHYPDLGIGRIPVDTAAQAIDIVAKIIAYEQNPVSDASFYKRMVVAGYFQDSDDDGYADRRFIKTSEEIRDYMMTQGFDVERIYVASHDDNPLYYNDGRYGNGEPLPADLLRANGFAWDGDSDDVANAVNQGVFILNHRDHGGFYGWGSPSFYRSDVEDLTNGNRLPLVFSINCQTGWFDNETDDPDENTDYGSVCFAEQWLRTPAGGAVGVFGATRISYSGYNDWLAHGFYDAIWPDFLSYSDQDATLSDVSPRMGDVLNYGKMYLEYTNYSYASTRLLEFEEFHYYGDPTTRIAIGGTSSPEHSFTIYNDGDADLVVSAITKQNDSPWLSTDASLPMTISPGGSQEVGVMVAEDLVHGTANADRLLIASNDPDENPYPDGVYVNAILYGAGSVAIDEVTLTREISGNGNGAINSGETIEMDVDLYNDGSGVAYNVQGTFSTSSPYVTLIDNRVSFSAVSSLGAPVGESDVITFDVSNSVSGQQSVTIQATFTASNGGPWYDSFTVVIQPDSRPPYTPSYPVPSNGAMNQMRSMWLRWQGGDPDGDTVFYQVHLSDSYIYPYDMTGFDAQLAWSPYPRYYASYLDPYTQYYWYVVATDEHGASTTGPVWEFKTLWVQSTTHRNVLPMVIR